MFESLEARITRAAAGRAAEQARRLAVALEAELPGDVAVAAQADGVRLAGRGLWRRPGLASALAWAMAELDR